MIEESKHAGIRRQMSAKLEKAYWRCRGLVVIRDGAPDWMSIAEGIELAQRIIEGNDNTIDDLIAILARRKKL